jgi:ketosteroid isomerase-like protein
MRPAACRYAEVFGDAVCSRAFVFIAGASGVSTRTPAMTDNNNEEQIGTLVENWAAAVRARDVEGAVAHHTDDIVMFDVPLPVQSRGVEEYRKTWELFFAKNRGGPGSFEVTELRITASDTVAYCHALLKIFDSTARLTMGLRKEGGQWLVAHEHHSYPAT